MLYLGWLGVCSHMLDSYKVAISPYDHLIFDFWCHLMLLLMLLCCFAWLWPLLLSSLVAPSLLLALILYWVWALLMHPTPKNQVVPMCPPYIPISNLLFQSTFDLLLSILQIKLFLVLCENWSVKLSRTWWHTLFFLILKNLTLWLSYVELLCLQVVSWKLA
jgi:hypothetical protein